jgi:hypothetical protein
VKYVNEIGFDVEVCVLQDKFLDRFLSLNTALEEGNIPARIGEANMETELKARYGTLLFN